MTVDSGNLDCFAHRIEAVEGQHGDSAAFIGLMLKNIGKFDG